MTFPLAGSPAPDFALGCFLGECRQQKLDCVDKVTRAMSGENARLAHGLGMYFSTYCSLMRGVHWWNVCCGLWSFKCTCFWNTLHCLGLEVALLVTLEAECLSSQMVTWWECFDIRWGQKLGLRSSRFSLVPSWLELWGRALLGVERGLPPAW